MKADSIKILIFICASIAVGWGFGYPLAFGLAASMISNLWILNRAIKLHNWFIDKNEMPHAEKGVFYHLHRDIHAMRKHNHSKNRALQKTLQQFRNAAGVMPEAIVVFDEVKGISWSNALAKDLLGVEHPRDKGQRITNLIRTPDFVDAFSKQNLQPVDVDIKAPNQADKTININIIQLAENNQMLVARNISRLTNINQAQKNFVTNVSHELKTPLTVTLGYLEILETHPELPKSLTKPVSDMMMQTQRMQSTIEDLLYLAKLESQSNQNDVQKQHEPIDLNDIVNEIMLTAQPIAEQKAQTITIEINDQLLIKANRRELTIAFNNLIINAIRYTPKKGDILVKWHHKGTNAVFSVIDNGIGIAPNHIKNLTKRFYRVDQGRSREKGGTGLGLAIVKNILDRHQATLEITSNLGSGSCFNCIFPRT